MEDGALEELAKNSIPCVGMEFESDEAAHEFYNEYGRIVGFSINRDYHTKSKKDGIMISRKFFDDNHNHLLHIPQFMHMMPSQRKLCDAQGINVDVVDDTGISLKALHDLISALVGGKEFVGFVQKDKKTYLRAKRQRNLPYDEAGSLLRYFQQQATKNPYFYFAFQLDVDEMTTNIFWTDHQMITDYGIFGDVVSFDTIFRTNKEYRSLALFTGFNHFRMTVIFGAALLYDETTASFEWLFETFLHAMSGKKHVSFFTDQDQAMAKEISKIMPEALHRMNIMEIPKRYILGQWKLDAKDYAIEETVTVVENDPKLVIAACYRDLCPRMVKLTARSSEYKPTYQLVDETLRDLCAKVDNIMTSLGGSGASSSRGNIEVGTKEFVVDPNFA
ncbi:protein FAR1-RELATED SEQUENCE 5-like [Camellia sinensis]|uniref:protein FAR1-RELATED SEQUENCE 5-like n=1 Tax=Camellia sinensis TaxID=4442 RepID=UPI0010360CA7|nr:protein FAR1-RELATED SEQUENCE 5-like [Camellia sinensis]